MGKKKRGHPDLEEILSRPWCYYCERDFDDLKILIDHQRAKHFKCERCGRRLNTAGGLNVHMNQVHKETLTSIDNALPNRSNLDVEIFGMEGIPEEIVSAHKQRVLTQYAQAEAERRAATGNPPGGAAAAGAGGLGGNPPKKPKFESPAEIKKRLAEHKAKMAAEKAAAEANAAGGGPAPVMGEVNHMAVAGGGGGGGPGFGPGPGFSPPPSSFPPQQAPYGGPPAMPMTGHPMGYGGSPPPFGHSPVPFAQQPAQFGPPVQGFPNVPTTQYGQPGMPQPHFPTQAPFPQQPQFPHGPPQFQGGPPRGFGSISPPVPFRGPSPPQLPAQPPRQSSIGPAPGLPQRPSFSAPPVNHHQMQQLHSGQMIASPGMPFNNGMHNAGGASGPNGSHNDAAAQPQTNGQNHHSAPPSEQKAGMDQHGNGSHQNEKEKKSKKEKDKGDIKLVYSDNEVSPEEKMAKLARYAFDPSAREERVLGETTAAVTGTVGDNVETMESQA